MSRINSTVVFPNAGEQFTSDFFQQQLRAGLNYRFGAGPTITNPLAPTLSAPTPDVVNFHGQTTIVWQGYPAMRLANSFAAYAHVWFWHNPNQGRISGMSAAGDI
jgi:hypothetical protein